MLDPDPTSDDALDLDVWPVPHRSRLRRIASPVARWFAYLMFFAVVVAGQSTGPGTDTPRASLEKRVRRLREGGTDAIRARIIGRSAWCPSFPDENVIQLRWRSAVSTLGRARTIPIDRISPVAVHAPRTKPGAEHLPRRYWVLDLDGAGGPGSIAATIDDLALLGTAVDWSPPPGLRDLTRRR